ncbi:MAG TPA: hypothetical protein VLF91_04525 [Candidatus Saccharimonadales bacterium]|nr:hypothetical protein [Candidatus Saccharimonadales bacterium]
MVADIYKPDLWTDFFLLVGTGAVTLTGLVFVALSLNLKTIAIDATHRFRAIGTLTGFAAVFLRSALALMGGQNYKWVGAELLAVASVAGFVYVYGYVRANRSGSGASLIRTTTGTSLYIIEMVGATLLILGHSAGIYIAATALVINTCYMITGAWLLVLGAHQK